MFVFPYTRSLIKTAWIIKISNLLSNILVSSVDVEQKTLPYAKILQKELKISRKNYFTSQTNFLTEFNQSNFTKCGLATVLPR